ncbi:uncharacterized protein LOC134840545 isoform X4 [Symsagittifera roscoffensis]|uniref:uncharacterized protein LOC134840545 isoform X4 n=1 Tax=Symsagittifera roscoffensis TaxID=84072 RepID=UPI00307C63FF
MKIVTRTGRLQLSTRLLASQLAVLIIMVPSLLQGNAELNDKSCEDTLKIIQVDSPMLSVELTSKDSIRVSNPYLKPPGANSNKVSPGANSADGQSGADSTSNDAASSSGSNGGGGSSSISKRESKLPDPLSNQYFHVKFDSVYEVKSFKLKSGEIELSFQYSRPGDGTPLGRTYRNANGMSRLKFNQYFDSSKWYLQSTMDPSMVLNEMRINLMGNHFDNSTSSHKEFSITLEHGACIFNDMESYTITEPSEEHPDIGYDGTLVNGYLTRGLGSLILGGTSDDKYVEWVKRTSNFDKVQMAFAFRNKQNVTSVKFDFDKPMFDLVYSPLMIKCYGSFYRDSDTSKSEERTATVDDPQAASINMKLNFVAHSVRCEMIYRPSSDASIRLHLVQFETKDATPAEIAAADPEKDKTIVDPDGEGDGSSDLNPDLDSNSTAPISPDEGGDSGDSSAVSGGGGGGSISGGGGKKPTKPDDSDNANRPTNPPPFGIAGDNMKYLTMFIIVLAILCGVILTIIGLGVGWMWYRKKKLKLKKKYESAYSKGEFFGAGPPSEHPYQALSQLDQYETPRYHMNTTLDLASNGRQLPDIPPHHPGYPPHDGDLGKNYKAVSVIRLSQRSLASSRIYTEPDLVSQIRDQTTLTRGAGGSDSLARNVARAYAETDITQIQNELLSGIFGGTFEMSNVLEYPKQNLVFLKELGKGQFATVHLCLAPGIRDSNPDTPVKVAVKFLHQDALYEQREAFKKEVKVLSDLRHPNIIMLYGVCTRSGPPMMILEFMENGDLYQFLRRHEPEVGTYASSSNIQTLSGLGGICRTLGAGTLVYMARQIAAGMSHVESVNFIHRDLASRNCLVGLSYTVKIGDFGMSRELYSNDYYKIEGKAVLPIRWMAWESIVMGKFSNKSDVWSFGVMLWELFTLAKCQPFSNRTDEQVIENLTNIWEKKESETLPQPNNCPSEVFDLMNKCWHPSPDLRPNFKELHTQLTKLNTLDYSPSSVPGGPPHNAQIAPSTSATFPAAALHAASQGMFTPATTSMTPSVAPVSASS